VRFRGRHQRGLPDEEGQGADGQRCHRAVDLAARLYEHVAEADDRARDDRQAECVREQRPIHERPMRKRAERRAQVRCAAVRAERARDDEECADEERAERCGQCVTPVVPASAKSDCGDIDEGEDQELDSCCGCDEADRRHRNRHPA
jgi:hypothetical protein